MFLIDNFFITDNIDVASYAEDNAHVSTDKISNHGFSVVIKREYWEEMGKVIDSLEQAPNTFKWFTVIFSKAMLISAMSNSVLVILSV